MNHYNSRWFAAGEGAWVAYFVHVSVAFCGRRRLQCLNVGHAALPGVRQGLRDHFCTATAGHRSGAGQWISDFGECARNCSNLNPAYASLINIDENHKGRHVDPNVRTALSKALLDHVRDPDRYLSDAGHVEPGCNTREYFADSRKMESFWWIQQEALRAIATIGECQRKDLKNFVLNYYENTPVLICVRVTPDFYLTQYLHTQHKIYLLTYFSLFV